VGKAVEEEAPEGAPEWLVTFSDLVSLLVTLFIMMLTFSTQETQDLAKAVDLLKGSFGVLRDDLRDTPDMAAAPDLQPNVKGGVTQFDPDVDPSVENHVRELEGKILDSRQLDQGIRIVPVTVTGFAPGDDRPSVELADEMRRIGRMLRRHKDRKIRIEGFADPRSDRHSPVGDHDVLALARARRVARLFGLEGVQYEAMEIVAKGIRGTRGDTSTEAGQARNRRVEIVIEPKRKKAGSKAGKKR